MVALLSWVAAAFGAGACGGDGEPTDGREGAVAEASSEVTWHADIAPLLAERCWGCHHEGGIGTVELSTYESAAALAPLILDAVVEQRMPPFLARDTDGCVPRHGWRDDPTFSEADEALLAAWVQAGAPQGDAERAAPLPAAPALELDRVDLELTIPGEVEVDGRDDRFVCFVLPSGLEEDTWIDATQVVPGNPSIVHHVVLFEDVQRSLPPELAAAGRYDCFGDVAAPGAEFRAGWAPGGQPGFLPEGAAMRLSAGARMIMQVHYHPTGEPETDRGTTVQFRRFEGTPRHLSRALLLGNLGRSTRGATLLPGEGDRGRAEFRIPAGEQDHVETMLFELGSQLPPQGRIWSATTHMHYIGSAMQVHLRRAAPEADEPEQECLVDTPRWDFDWQRGYVYDAEPDELPILRPGDTLALRCRYDNSMRNPGVRRALRERGLSAPTDVALGSGSLDEMCVAIIGLLVPAGGDAGAP